MCVISAGTYLGKLSGQGGAGGLLGASCPAGRGDEVIHPVRHESCFDESLLHAVDALPDWRALPGEIKREINR